MIVADFRMIMLFAFRMNAEADEEHFSNGSYR